MQKSSALAIARCCHFLAFGVPSLIWCVVFLGTPPAPSGEPAHPSSLLIARTLVYAAFICLALATPVGYFIRNQTYKRHWQAGAVTPRGYVTGNLRLYACVDVASVLALLAASVDGSVRLAGLPLFLAAAVIVLNYPTGAPMHPQPPRLGKPAE